jgi:hypothetical protein
MGTDAEPEAASSAGPVRRVTFMDLDDTRPTTKNENPEVLPAKPVDDQKELAWAFLGLILWSGVVLIGVFGAGYVVGHSIFHLW